VEGDRPREPRDLRGPETHRGVRSADGRRPDRVRDAGALLLRLRRARPVRPGFRVLRAGAAHARVVLPDRARFPDHAPLGRPARGAAQLAPFGRSRPAHAPRLGRGLRRRGRGGLESRRAHAGRADSRPRQRARAAPARRAGLPALDAAELAGRRTPRLRGAVWRTFVH
jgi:hypothetical protein